MKHKLGRLYKNNDDYALADLLYCRESFYKLYEGLTNKNGEYEKIIFYNEREWRYVPKLEILIESKIPISLSREKYKDEITRRSSTEKLEKYCTLHFEPKDIKYLIVEKDEDIFEFRRHIETIKGRNYSHDDITLLLSKFIRTKDLIEDF